ncbi:MAG: peptidoglycan DD-metalloendopeptidase family protein [Peptococcaceae bacterium]|nr:peptidoglycan DD-metalloendopeptidase family protein [Peptococcaceae bacterium]
MTFLQISAMGAVLTGLIVLLRKAAGQRLLPGCYLALWALAGARFLFPVNISSAFSVYNLFAILKPDSTTVVYEQIPGTVNGASQWIDDGGTATAGGAGLDWLFVLWLTGALLCFLYMVSSHWQFRRWYAASLPVEDKFVKHWQNRHSLRRNYQIRKSRMVQTPLTYGLFRPVILLPADKVMLEEELHLVLLHEWNHIRHLDVLWQWVLVIICSIHWFNPAVWVMHRFCRQDLELFCDAATARTLSAVQNRSYAMLLLQQAASVRRPVPVFSSFRFTGYQRMEERIQVIMKPKKFSWKIAVITVCLFCAGGIVFATSAQAEENHADVWMNASPAEEHVWPVASEDAKLTLAYGTRQHPVTGELHKIDHISIGGADAEGSAILAADDGVVKDAGYDARKGNYILIAHDNDTETCYWHCDKLLVGIGGTVHAGEAVATLGKTGDATGPCLSFAVYQNGKACDPVAWLEGREESERTVQQPADERETEK